VSTSRSDDDDDLRLNTLYRFAKRSPRLVLEEHGHCEVPAGCGGVVLRWVGRDAAVFVIANVSCPTPREERPAIWLDGKRLEGSRVELTAGTHVFAARVVPEPLRVGARSVVPFLCVVRDDASGPRERTVFLRSAPFVVRYTTDDLDAEEVTSPRYDDGLWTQAPPLSVAPEALPERWRSFGLWLAESYGVEPLELPSAPVVWVRAKFEVRRA